MLARGAPSLRATYVHPSYLRPSSNIHRLRVAVSALPRTPTESIEKIRSIAQRHISSEDLTRLNTLCDLVEDQFSDGMRELEDLKQSELNCKEELTRLEHELKQFTGDHARILRISLLKALKTMHCELSINLSPFPAHLVTSTLTFATYQPSKIDIHLRNSICCINSAMP